MPHSASLHVPMVMVVNLFAETCRVGCFIGHGVIGLVVVARWRRGCIRVVQKVRVFVFPQRSSTPAITVLGEASHTKANDLVYLQLACHLTHKSLEGGFSIGATPFEPVSGRVEETSCVFKRQQSGVREASPCREIEEAFTDHNWEVGFRFGILVKYLGHPAHADEVGGWGFAYSRSKLAGYLGALKEKEWLPGAIHDFPLEFAVPFRTRVKRVFPGAPFQTRKNNIPRIAALDDGLDLLHGVRYCSLREPRRADVINALEPDKRAILGRFELMIVGMVRLHCG